MFLALASVSPTSIWVLTDSKAKTILASHSWSESQTKDISSGLEPSLKKLLAMSEVQLGDIKKIFCVTGPGSFTGLRTSSAFVQGLARALHVELSGIPSFDLLGKEFFIPLRAQKATTLSWQDYAKLNFEFLKISSQTDFTVAQPHETDTVWGCREKAAWPEAANLLRGVQANLQTKQTFGQELNLTYGQLPSISSQTSSTKARPEQS